MYVAGTCPRVHAYVCMCVDAWIYAHVYECV